MKTLLSLFDFSGNWSNPYRKAGWNVIQLDIKHGIDIMEVNTEWLYENIFDAYETVDGILAAPPCTDFTVSCAQWWKKKDADGRTEKSKKLVYQALRIIDVCMPDFWALENPVGRIGQLIPELGKPKFFQPYWYGDPYSKKTALYGKFKMPEKTMNVGMFKSEKSNLDETEPEWIYAGTGSGRRYAPLIWNTGGTSEKTKELRSITPPGFADAFYLANH